MQHEDSSIMNAPPEPLPMPPLQVDIHSLTVMSVSYLSPGPGDEEKR